MSQKSAEAARHGAIPDTGESTVSTTPSIDASSEERGGPKLRRLRLFASRPTSMLSSVKYCTIQQDSSYHRLSGAQSGEVRMTLALRVLPTTPRTGAGGAASFDGAAPP